MSEDCTYEVRVSFTDSLIPIHSNANCDIEFTISLQHGEPVRWVLKAADSLELFFNNEIDFAAKIHGTMT